MKTILLTLVVGLCLFALPPSATAQIVPAGSGSYTTQFPEPAVAGRREKPRGTAFGVEAVPKVTSNLAGQPVPTNDWWSTLVWTTGNSTSHGWPFYAYPLSFRSRPEGLAIEYTTPTAQARRYAQPMSTVYPMVVGVTGLNTSESKVHDFSDWTVTAAWFEGGHNFTATMGLGMPFVYFEKGSSETAMVKLNFPSQVTINGNVLLIENSFNGADYAVYGPAGSTWLANGSTYTSSLNGKNYWSMALLPEGVNPATAAAAYAPHAMVFPGNTTASYQYNQGTGEVTTDFVVTPDVKEGGTTAVLQGLLPHQWGNLAGSSAQPGSYSHPSVRGQIKYLAGNSFTVSRSFKGILPTLPDLGDYSAGFDRSELYAMVDGQKNTVLQAYTDSYNDGKLMNKLGQLVKIADQLGHTEARDLMLAEMKTRLQDWLSAESGELDFVMYYNDTWGAMLGYPAGHGQDNNLNDHHFHWGYMIHMAALVEQFEPGWAAQWGPMVNLLVRDAGSTDRNDPMFPYLRNFSPYAGHSWANGSGTFPDGNDQESSSESMQFHSALIHWGEVTGNTAIRDLGIYLYTTEQSAIEEYYWDVNDRVFQPEHGYEAVSRLWGDGYDAYTFWTTDIGPMWGINFLPIHGGSLYLGHDPALVQTLWNDIAANTGILSKEQNPNIWYDVYWMYLSFTDPAQALTLYNDYQNYPVEFGESQAHTYHWLHNMNALGQVDASVTANHPIAAVFNKNGDKTYVAHNYGSSAITVNFSDGASLSVPARSMATSKDVNASITLTAPASGTKISTAPNSFTLQASVTGSVDRVDFYEGSTLLGSDYPDGNGDTYSLTLTNVADFVYNYRAVAVVGSLQESSNIAQVTVGAGLPQSPYGGTAAVIPGTLEAGKYDEGGQNAAYSDNNAWDEGGARGEGVDVSNEPSEGLAVGWIEAGEWIEFTVNVTQGGTYRIDTRVASGLTEGGGPFHFELDEVPVGPSETVPGTGDWGAWTDLSFDNVPLAAGQHLLRVAFDQGGFNLGRMTFVRTGGGSDTQAPTVPGSLLATNVTASSVTLGWGASTDNVGVAGYEVFQNGNQIQTVTGTSAVVSGLSANTSYGFGVRALDAAGNRSAQATLTQSTAANAGDTQAPTTPGSLSVSGTTASSLTLSWGASTDNVGVASYEVFLDGASQGTTGSLSYTYSGLAANTAYTLGVRAADAAGNASSTATTTGTTDPGSTGGACTGDGINGTGNGIDYTWSVAGGANPTITFLPARANVGNNIVILYYQVNGSGYAGYTLSANGSGNFVQAISAASGATVDFYYTYSVPEGGERNSSASPHSVTVGNCGGSSTVSVTGVSVSPTSVSLDVSQTSALSASVSPGNATNQGVSWSSSNTAVATVSSSGVVSAVSAGSATITVATTDGGYTATTAVTVNSAQAGCAPLTRVQAEDYSIMSGIQTEATSDTGGGQNVGWIDGGDWMVWDVNLPACTYTVRYRVASPSGGGQLQLEKAGGGAVYGLTSVPATGGWQSWTTVTETVTIGENLTQIAVYLPTGGFNLNWIEFEATGSRSTISNGTLENLSGVLTMALAVYPNPATEHLTVAGLQGEFATVAIYGLDGRMHLQEALHAADQQTELDVSGLRAGVYLLRLVAKDGTAVHRKFVKE